MTVLTLPSASLEFTQDTLGVSVDDPRFVPLAEELLQHKTAESSPAHWEILLASITVASIHGPAVISSDGLTSLAAGMAETARRDAARIRDALKTLASPQPSTARIAAAIPPGA